MVNSWPPLIENATVFSDRRLKIHVPFHTTTTYYPRALLIQFIMCLSGFTMPNTAAQYSDLGKV